MSAGLHRVDVPAGVRVQTLCAAPFQVGHHCGPKLVGEVFKSCRAACNERRL